MLLENKVAIVTGGARGIGRGIALKFADEGCNIAIADILKEEANKTAKEITSRGITCIFVNCDVSQSDQVNKMVSEVISKFGKIDILVNNAGIGPLPRSIVNVPEEEWDRVLEVNLKSMFLCCKAVVPYMKDRKFGKIINIASLAAISPFGPVIHYSSSKAGVLNFTRDLALELAPFNICVNAILPGMITTDMQNNVIPPNMTREEYFKQHGKDFPLGRVGTPEDVAKAALFFASNLSDYITADRLIVAGGSPYRYIEG